jgi:N6-L-threonylcarbamoyladenine synthase
MFILGIETSCDETSAAVLRDGREILSNVVYSQDIHSQYGGVVPEFASRDHIRNIVPVVKKSLKDAGIRLSKVDVVAVTRGPGLIGALLVGLSFAKSIAYSLHIPFIAVNHLEGHIYANQLSNPELEPPVLGLIVSGGHTDLLIIKKRGEYQLLGSTLDDACGEAFDKVANLLGLSYPGGPEIEKLAKGGNPDAISFPLGRVKKYDFSFSGLKTAILYYVKELSETKKVKQRQDIAASFQRTAITMLVKKVVKAVDDLKIMKVAISGGVASNGRLREMFSREAKKRGFEVYFPHKELCTDNAAMIAACGYDHYKRGEVSPLTIKAEPTETIYMGE